MNIEKGSVHYESLSDKTKQSATDVKDTTVICKVLGNNVFCHLAAKLLIHTIKACTYCSDFPLPYFVIPTSNFKHLWHSSCLCQRGIEGKAAVSTTTPSIENAVSDENTLKSHFTETLPMDFFMPLLLPKYTATHQLISYWVVCRPSVVCQIWFSWLHPRNVKYMCSAE